MNDDSQQQVIQQQLIKDMLMESLEGLDRFDRELVALEKGEAEADTMNDIFRVIHTMKGTAGCIGLQRIEMVAHAGENVLSLLREGKLSIHPELISTLLALSDALREILRVLEQTGHDGGDADYSALLERLRKCQSLPSAPVAQPPIENTAFGLFDDEPGTHSPEVAKPVASDHPSTASAPVASVSETSAPGAPSGKLSVSESAIRVDVVQLDKLMNLVGELVLARNQIVEFTSQAENTALVQAAQRLNIITTELQEGVMKTRMQPISNIWSKLPRIVRDVAQELGKEVELVMEGQSTELDRTVIESIKDPLIHIIRNSIDHGIEAPDRRRAVGKAEKGLLHLRAFHEGGQVNIEVIDDGKGIDLAKVKSKALDAGMVTPDQLSRMTDREALNLIFLPGLSTADQVTAVSGRGVGMDVVRTNIEKIGGSVDIQTTLGEGTTLRIKIPLTLAIIPALVITTCGERFAIPQVSLVELVRLEGEQALKGIEHVFGAPVYRLRGKLLPLVCLDAVLHLERSSSQSADNNVANIIVLKAGEQQFGLIVDAVNDTQEIVVKPLGKHLKGLPVFAGATIMGDGMVALILDVFGLAQHAHVVSQSGKNELSESAGTASKAGAAIRQSLLLFSLGASHRFALPLSSVGRLEKFPSSQVEREGDREVVQYRGQIMPLVRLANVLGGTDATNGELPVVVYTVNHRNFGLVVGRIDDIVEETVVLQNEQHRSGILGSSVIQGRVTEMIDVAAIISTQALAS